MTEGIRIREATDRDMPEILEVLKAALGETPLLRRTPELFRWKHYNNPFGRSIVLVATEKARVVGVRAFMKWELTTPLGHAVRCVRAVDTATHPDFERRGIFRELTESAVEVATGQGVQLIFNTPNEKSGAGYIKMGWQEIGPVGAMIRVRLGSSIAANPSTPPVLDEAIPGIVPFVVPAMTDRTPTGLRTKREPAYLHWRFADHPTARYGLVSSRAGGVVARASSRSSRSETRIADILGDADHQTVKNLVAANRSRYIATWFTRTSEEAVCARKAGLRNLPGIKTLQLVGRVLAPIDVDVLDIGSWDLAMSDLELL